MSNLAPEGIIFDTPAERVSVVVGFSPEELRERLETSETEPRRPVLILDAPPFSRIETDTLLDALARTALGLWPAWFDGIDFSQCTSSAAGLIATDIAVSEASKTDSEISRAWIGAAIGKARMGEPPRVDAVAAEIEARQLCLAISPKGLIVAIPAHEMPPPAHAHGRVAVVEWLARCASCSVVLLASELPPNEPPYDRIVFGSVVVRGRDAVSPPAPPLAPAWIGPIRGRPHPQSGAEHRLAAALNGDAELTGLFSFNQVIETVHGARPKVDMLWRIGRLVVEIDGYLDHSSPAAFANDRNRDSELLISGYAVLRLVNDEVEQDIERAIEKIRAAVLNQRARSSGAFDHGLSTIANADVNSLDADREGRHDVSEQGGKEDQS